MVEESHLPKDRLASVFHSYNDCMSEHYGIIKIL